MIHTRKNLLRIGLAIAAELAASHNVRAQCVSGMGASPARLASQNWAASPPLNLTASQIAGSPIVNPLPQFSDISVDSSGHVFLLGPDTFGQKLVWLVDRTTDAAGNHYVSVQHSYSLPSHSISGLIAAGGAVWATTTDGYVFNMSAYTGPTAPAGISVGTVLGATYDGTNVWFSTKAGVLQKVALPNATSAGTITETVRPHVVNNPSGPMAFDGQHVWYASNSALIEFDPVTYDATNRFDAGGSISSLVFDGVYLWIANAQKAALIKFDPDTHQTINDITPGGSGFTSVVFDGAAILAFSPQAATITSIRACDGKVLPSPSLPGLPLQAAFDGYKTWILYSGNTTITVR